MAEPTKILTTALIAAALATSLTVMGGTLANGSGGGTGQRGYWRGNIALDSGCQRWIPGFGKVYVCN